LNINTRKYGFPYCGSSQPPGTIFTLSLLSPLGKGGSPSYEQILNPLYLRMICANIDYNWPIGSEEEVENVKMSDGRTDRHQKMAIRKAHLSFQLR
jgi:hypothetical protein